MDANKLEVSDSARDTYPSQLFNETKPTVVEMYNILFEVTGRSKNNLFDILVSLYKQKCLFNFKGFFMIQKQHRTFRFYAK